MFWRKSGRHGSSFKRIDSQPRFIVRSYDRRTDEKDRVTERQIFLFRQKDIKDIFFFFRQKDIKDIFFFFRQKDIKDIFFFLDRKT